MQKKGETSEMTYNLTFPLFLFYRNPITKVLLKKISCKEEASSNEKNLTLEKQTALNNIFFSPKILMSKSRLFEIGLSQNRDIHFTLKI